MYNTTFVSLPKTITIVIPMLLSLQFNHYIDIIVIIVVGTTTERPPLLSDLTGTTKEYDSKSGAVHVT